MNGGEPCWFFIPSCGTIGNDKKNCEEKCIQIIGNDLKINHLNNKFHEQFMIQYNVKYIYHLNFHMNSLFSFFTIYKPYLIIMYDF